MDRFLLPGLWLCFGGFGLIWVFAPRPEARLPDFWVYEPLAMDLSGGGDC